MTGFEEIDLFFNQYVKNDQVLPIESTLLKVGLNLEGEKVSVLKELTPSQKKLRKAWIDQ